MLWRWRKHQCPAACRRYGTIVRCDKETGHDGDHSAACGVGGMVVWSNIQEPLERVLGKQKTPAGQDGSRG